MQLKCKWLNERLGVPEHVHTVIALFDKEESRRLFDTSGKCALTIHVSRVANINIYICIYIYIYIYKSGEFACRLWVEITVYLQNGNSDMFHTGFKWNSTCFVICTKFANQFRLVSSFYGGNKNSNHV